MHNITNADEASVLKMEDLRLTDSPMTIKENIIADRRMDGTAPASSVKIHKTARINHWFYITDPPCFLKRRHSQTSAR